MVTHCVGCGCPAAKPFDLDQVVEQVLAHNAPELTREVARDLAMRCTLCCLVYTDDRGMIEVHNAIARRLRPPEQAPELVM